MSKFDPYGHLRLKLNPDGTITRLLNCPTAKTNPDHSTGEPVLSKDAILNAENNTSIRIFLPIKQVSNDTTIKRFPIFVYLHGCGWVQFRAKNPTTHQDREKTAAAIKAIIILVDYRLAPESRLPAQYEDAVDTLLWLKRQALEPDGEQWLKDYADFSKCYLAGSGNGGNMVFNAALRALDLDLNPLKIAGLIMNQPLFGGVKRTKSELRYATDQLLPLPVLDLMWELVLPRGTDRDHRYCNPMLDKPLKNKLSLLPRCLVIGFGMEPTIDRQQDFVKMLILHGVQVDSHFDDAGFHRIEVVDPRRQAVYLNLLKEFIHR